MLHKFLGCNAKELSHGRQGPGGGPVAHAELIRGWQAPLADQRVNRLNFGGRRLGIEIHPARGGWLGQTATARSGAVSQRDRRYHLFTAAPA